MRCLCCATVIKSFPAGPIRPRKRDSPRRIASGGNAVIAFVVPCGQVRQSGEHAFAAPRGFSDTPYPQWAAKAWHPARLLSQTLIHAESTPMHWLLSLVIVSAAAFATLAGLAIGGARADLPSTGAPKDAAKTGASGPLAGSPTDEDAEVAAYFKKKGWSLYVAERTADGKSLFSMIVSGDKQFENITLTPDDYKMIGKSKTVQLLDLRKVNNTDDGLKALVGMPQLQGIVVFGDDVTNAGIKALAQCKTLEQIILMTKKGTDAGVKELAALPKLRMLHLQFMTLDGSAFEAFAGSKTLQSVNLEYVEGFSDDGAKNLAKLPNLNELKIGSGFGERKLTTAGIKAIVDVRVPAIFEFDKKLIDDDLFESLVAKGWLYGPTPPGVREKKPATAEEVKYLVLNGSKVTDKGMRAVLHCTNIRSIHLQRTGVTDDTLKKLAAFKKLDYVALDKTKVTGVGLDAISGLPIKHVAMEDCVLTEDAFKSFGKMTALEELWLPDAKMKAEWLKHVATLPKLKEINLMGADFDDAAVKHVKSMPSLQNLTLNNTNLGDTGFEELLKAEKLKRLFVDETKVSKDVYLKAKKEHPKMSLYFYKYDK